MCDMVKPSFIPPPDIRQLRDLMRYRMKLTNEEVQAAVDGAISHEQAIKLRECLQHLDELETHKTNIEKEILRLAQQYPYQLELLQTVPGFSGNIMTAIALISEIGADMSVFPSAKHLVSWAGCCPRNDQSSKKVKSTRISRAGVYLKPLLVQVAIQPFTANADKLSAAGALEIRCQICDGRFLSMWVALFIFLGCPLSPCPKNLHVHNGRIVILASVAWIF